MSKFTDLETASLGADKATDERALFEASARKNPYAIYSFALFGHGIVNGARTYLDTKTEAAWLLWQERAALAAVPASEPDRFFMDHGLWHDRVTGQHMYTQDQYDEESRACLAEGKQNAMLAAAPAPVSGMPDLASLTETLRMTVRLLENFGHGGCNGVKEAREVLRWANTPNPAGETK